METRGREPGDISKGWGVCFQAPNKGHRKAEISWYQSLNWIALRVSPTSSSRVFLLPLCHCQGFQMTAWGPCCFQGWQPLRDCERSHRNTVLANLKVKSPVKHFFKLEAALPQCSSWNGSLLVYLLPAYAKHMPAGEKAFPSAETRTQKVSTKP